MVSGISSNLDREATVFPRFTPILTNLLLSLYYTLTTARINETKEQQQLAGLLHEEFSTTIYGTRWAGEDIPR
jgi:hypothetical protein